VRLVHGLPIAVDGLPIAACSYHLHTLAKYGFVAEDTAHSHDGRERPWRVTVTLLNVPCGTGTPAVRDAARLLTASVQASADELRESYRDRSGSIPPS